MYYLIALLFTTLFCVQYSHSCTAEHIKNESQKIPRSGKYPVRITVHTHKQGIFIIDQKSTKRFKIREIPQNIFNVPYDKGVISRQTADLETVSLNLDAPEKDHILKVNDVTLLEEHRYSYPLIHIQDFCKNLKVTKTPGIRKIQQVNPRTIKFFNIKKYNQKFTKNFRGNITDIEIDCDSIKVTTNAQEIFSTTMGKYEN